MHLGLAYAFFICIHIIYLFHYLCEFCRGDQCVRDVYLTVCKFQNFRYFQMYCRLQKNLCVVETDGLHNVTFLNEMLRNN